MSKFINCIGMPMVNRIYFLSTWSRAPLIGRTANHLSLSRSRIDQCSSTVVEWSGIIIYECLDEFYQRASSIIQVAFPIKLAIFNTMFLCSGILCGVQGAMHLILHHNSCHHEDIIQEIKNLEINQNICR